MMCVLRKCVIEPIKKRSKLFKIMSPDRKGLIKIISTRYFLVIKEINKYLVDMILINKKNLSGRAGLCHTKF
jgi:hypothetical protein